MEFLTDKKQIRKTVLLFACCYMVSYLTRINFGAVILEMATDMNIAKSLLSLSITGSFITYGSGQIVSGICGDKFAPKKLVLYGLLVTTLMNLFIPLCNNAYVMLVVWCINGFAQAFMWPPMTRLMATLLEPTDYNKGIVTVNWGASLGTIIIYLIAPVLISLSGWRAMFLFSALCGVVMMIVWQKQCPDVSVDVVFTKKGKDAPKANISLFSPLLLAIMVAIVLKGMLRDGVTTWMPTYISETYHLSNSISILTGVILPVFTILCLKISEILYSKKFTNPILCSGFILSVGAVAAMVLYVLSGRVAALSVLFSALLAGSMHGANLILIGMVPPYFAKSGNISTVSGVLNACVYIGSAISTYGIALLSEKVGWSATVLIWFFIAALAAAICFFCVHPWNKEMETEE